MSTVDQNLHPASYYLDTVSGDKHWPPLAGDKSCDVCVIGGGFTGISAALNLAEQGFNVVLLESQYIGWGASGRNGGQAGGMPRQDVEELERNYGKSVAKQHWELNQAALTELKDRIRRHNIPCDWKDGIVSACRRDSELDWYRGHVDMLRADYQADYVDFLSAGDMAQLIESPVCRGGMIDRRSGHLHPLNYALGLARAADEAGASIHEQTHVSALKSDSQGCTISTPQGTVRAKYTVLGCNGYLEKLEPRLAGKIMPINNYMLATEPLPPALAEQVSRRDHAFYDTRFVVNYWRMSADKRLLFGGGENYSRRFPADIKRFVRKHMLEIYPQLTSTAIDYGWGGTLAVTMNRMPHFGRLPHNIYYAQGYSGHGVVLASFAGKLIAEALSGTAARFDVMANVAVPTFPGGTLLRWPGLVAAMFYYSLRDKLG